MQKHIASAMELLQMWLLSKRLHGDFSFHSLSQSAGASSQAERQAVNTICQGSAADLVKLAMIQLHKQLQEVSPAAACKLLLQVRAFAVQSDCCHKV